jgi:uncharacterized protein with PIN domain
VSLVEDSAERCMAYAVAAVAGLPLLFIGADFAKTDIAAA